MMIRPLVGAVDAAQQVEQGGFAGSARSDYRQKLATGDLQVELAQRRDLDLSHVVELVHLVQDYDIRFWRLSAWRFHPPPRFSMPASRRWINEPTHPRH